MSKIILRKYGEATTVPFRLFEIDGVDFKTDAAWVSGDVNLMKDEGAEAVITVAFVDKGQGYSQALTAANMQFARGVLYIVDQGTKVWLDSDITIETYGHASSQHPNMSIAMRGTNNASLEATSLAISGDIQELRDIVDALDLELDDLAKEATLTDMKGTGFDTLIHSLKEIKNRIG